ncbi:MAG: GGDEF domain-containing protein [Sphingobium sp.]
MSEIILQAGVDAVPENYELCHRFVTRSDPQVCAEFERVLAQSKSIDAATFQSIRDAAGPPRGQIDVEGHMANLDEQIAVMIGASVAAAGDAASYSASLSKGATNLGALDLGSDAAAIITDLISQTRSMSQRTAALEASLASASAELSVVRNDLEKAKVESGTDALTSLPNRRTFDSKLAEAVSEATRLQQPLSLAFGDVDHFKKFNDTWGHKLGDEVLRYVANNMVKHFGDLGLSARFGGEEFVVLLPKCTSGNAVKMSQRLCERLSARALKTRSDGKEIGKITMSVGVATLQPDETPKAFVERADEAMYAAKKAGRNRVMCAQG